MKIYPWPIFNINVVKTIVPFRKEEIIFFLFNDYNHIIKPNNAIKNEYTIVLKIYSAN